MTLGTHLIIDLYEVSVSKLIDVSFIEYVLTKAAGLCEAKIIGQNFHEFEGGGVTGVLLLAESHMSIHTWPEHNYAALDIFMCYNCDPNKCLDFITDLFSTKNFSCQELKRTV